MIDFDLAVPIDTKVIIQEYSGQYEACSQYIKGRVTKSVGNVGVAWGPTDGYHMLLDYVVQQLSSAPKVSNLRVRRSLSQELEVIASSNDKVEEERDKEDNERQHYDEAEEDEGEEDEDEDEERQQLEQSAHENKACMWNQTKKRFGAEKQVEGTGNVESAAKKIKNNK